MTKRYTNNDSCQRQSTQDKTQKDKFNPTWIVMHVMHRTGNKRKRECDNTERKAEIQSS